MGVLNKDIWHKEARNLTQRNNVQPRRWGMMVTVTEDATAANNTTWVLVRSLSDTNKNNNDNWQKITEWLSGGLSSNIVREYFDGDDATTEFDISEAGTVFVVEVGGQILEPVAGADGYTVSGTTVTIGTPPATGQRIGIYYYTTLAGAVTSAQVITALGYTPMDKLITANRQAASYTLVLADAGKLVEMNVAGANNLTVPPNSDVAFEIGTEILLAQYGAGQTTVVAGVGVTIRSASGNLNLTRQYSAATLVKIAEDEWYLFGDLTA